MDPNSTTLDYGAERDALCAAGIGAGLADLLIEAFREHDAAGRPAITLPSPEESLQAHRFRAALAPLLIAGAPVLDAQPERAGALATAIERDGVEGARSFLATLDPQLGTVASTALDPGPS